MAAPFAITNLEHILGVTNDPSRLVVIALIDPPRPFVRKFFRRLEYEHFDPRDLTQNALFHVFLMKWEGLTWCVAAFPQTYRSRAEALATECGLRLADGVPGMLGGDMSTAVPVLVGPRGQGTRMLAKQFPVHTDNAKQLENDWKVGSWQPWQIPQMLKAEEADLKAIQTAFDAASDNPL